MLAACTGVLVTVTSKDCEAVAPFASVAVTVMFALPALFPCTKRSFEITLAVAMAGIVADRAKRPAAV